MTNHGLDIAEGGLRAATTRDGDVLELTLTGTAELPAQQVLSGLLTRVRAHCAEAGVREVAIDLGALGFMNAWCLKHFVTFITAVQELPEDQRFRIHFRTNPSALWQRRSIHALECLAPELVVVDR